MNLNTVETILTILIEDKDEEGELGSWEMVCVTRSVIV